MKDLVIEKNHEAVCTSLQVAEKFHKRHDHIIRDIENLLINLPKNGGVDFFKKSSYADKKGEHRPMFYMNRDGFSLLVMGFTGKKALEWKLQYIKAFNQMEALLSEKNTQPYIEQRTQGKLIRSAETDVIKELVEYAKGQGSKHADMLYVTYSKLANSMAGITDREHATAKQISQLTFIENIILNQIRIGIEQDKHYKDIYKDCKKQIEAFKEIAYLNVG